MDKKSCDIFMIGGRIRFLSNSVAFGRPTLFRDYSNHLAKYGFKEVSKCRARVNHYLSSIFSHLDLFGTQKHHFCFFHGVEVIRLDRSFEIVLLWHFYIAELYLTSVASITKAKFAFFGIQLFHPRMKNVLAIMR